MLRNGRAATSAVLLGVLVLQTACVRAMGPPAPLRPGDLEQREAIEDTEQVHVWTLDGAEYRLKKPVIAERRLSGEQLNGSEISIPVDSIAHLQRYQSEYGWVITAVTLTALAAGFFLVAARVGDPGPF